MFVIAGKFKIKPERKVEFIELARVLIPLSQAESGCLSYGCNQSLMEPDTFLFFEEWASREAVELHTKTSYVQEFMSGSEGMLDGVPSVTLYEVAGTETL